MTEKRERDLPSPEEDILAIVDTITPDNIAYRNLPEVLLGISPKEYIAKQLAAVRFVIADTISDVENGYALTSEVLVLPLKNDTDTQRVIYEEIIERIHPETTYAEKHDVIGKDKETGRIETVIQYRKIPGLKPVISQDGARHEWLMRRIEPVGVATTVVFPEGEENPWIKIGQPEQLILRQIPEQSAGPHGPSRITNYGLKKNP